MKTILIALCLVSCQSGQQARQAGAQTPPKVGKVLLLENERTIEGEVERYQDFYRVRRSVGETQIPTHQVLALCADNKEAFEYLKKRTNLLDADERFKLAQWAQTRGLLAEALDESQAAIDLRPNHEPTKRLRSVIEQMDRREKEKKLFPEKPLANAGSEGIAPLPFEVSTESLGVFCQKIQPLLMNSCASCHATGKGGNFKLTRVYSGSATNKRIMQNNLAAVLNQVNPHQIGASPILVKSVSVHGDLNQAPLHNRSNQAFRMLEEWIRQTVGNSPVEPGSFPPITTVPLAIQTMPAGAQPLGTTATIQPVAAKSGGFAATPPPQAEKANPERPIGADTTEAEKTPTDPPGKAPPAKGPIDPYDPEEFNRGARPPAKSAPPRP